MTHLRRTAAVVAVLAVFATACGRLNDDGPASGGISHPTGADQLILRVEIGGGFVPIEYALATLPSVSIYGDGRMIVQGPQIEIYPGPALPNLIQTRLSEERIQAILEAARDAGLLGGDAHYGFDCVADAATTTFTVAADGRLSVVSAYALDLGEPGDCPGADVEARAKLAKFQTRLGELTVPAAGDEEPYEPSKVRVYVLPYRAEPELPQEPVAWPIGSLATFGEPVEAFEGARCGVVSDEDLGAVLALAQTANQLTPWTSDGEEHLLIFRPLLPDEHGC
jgi:hypothetical protein